MAPRCFATARLLGWRGCAGVGGGRRCRGAGRRAVQRGFRRAVQGGFRKVVQGRGRRAVQAWRPLKAQTAGSFRSTAHWRLP